MTYVRNILRARPKTLSPAEQKKLLEVTGAHVDGFRDHVLYSLALGTALRESELAALDVGDVAEEGWKSIRTKITLRTFKRSAKKTTSTSAGPEQRVFVPRMVRRKLELFLGWKRRHKEKVAAGAPLFISRSGGGRLSTRQLRNKFGIWQERAGFAKRHGFHVLRHTSLSNLYACTKDLLLVQQQARHASASTTEVYTHVSDEDVRRAVEELQS